jgi:hypothetical protein
LDFPVNSEKTMKCKKLTDYTDNNIQRDNNTSHVPLGQVG